MKLNYVCAHIIYETAPSTIKSVSFQEDDAVEKQVFGFLNGCCYCYCCCCCCYVCVCFFCFSSNSCSTRKLNHTYSEKITSNEQVTSAFTLNFHKPAKPTFDVLFCFSPQCEYKYKWWKKAQAEFFSGQWQILISLICIFDTYIMACVRACPVRWKSSHDHL